MIHSGFLCSPPLTLATVTVVVRVQPIQALYERLFAARIHFPGSIPSRRIVLVSVIVW